MSEKKRFRSGRRSRAISLSPSHNPNPQAIIQHLESLLKLRDEKISQLEEKIKSQDELVRCMEWVKKERDDLRKQNAMLIGKTAELSRKQSVGSFGSPPGQPGFSWLVGR